MSEIFIDKCNECGAPLEIDMDLMMYTAHCRCDSAIKRSVTETGKMNREIKRQTEEWQSNLLKAIEPPPHVTLFQRLRNFMGL